MDANYINQHLLGWCELFYGKDSECYSKRVKEGKKKKKVEYFIFGSKKLKVENKVTKQFALYIVGGERPLGLRKKTRYTISFFNLETNTQSYHAYGCVFTPDVAKAELKILKAEQKQLKKLKLPRTKSNFALRKVMIV